MYIQCVITCCLFSFCGHISGYTASKSCFHKAQIKVTGQGRSAPVGAPVGMQYYIQHILQTKFFFVIFETLSVC
jgi:hypothetical protein